MCPDKINVLEPSGVSKCSICSQVSGNCFGFSIVPECSFSGKFSGHDQIKTYQELGLTEIFKIAGIAEGSLFRW
jgi:hypothetical protein